MTDLAPAFDCAHATSIQLRFPLFVGIVAANLWTYTKTLLLLFHSLGGVAAAGGRGGL
jgi:hypothetical protein